MKFGSQLLLKSVQACHLASLLCWLTVSQKDRIGAVIYNGVSIREYKPTARQQGALVIMDALIKSHQEMLEAKENSVNLFHAFQHMLQLCPKGSDITVISDFYSISLEDKKTISQLRQHNRMRFVRIFDPLEQGKTQFRGTELVADQKQSMWLNFASKQTRESLATQYQKHQGFIKNITDSLAIPLHSLSAAIPLLQQLNHVAPNQTS